MRIFTWISCLVLSAAACAVASDRPAGFIEAYAANRDSGTGNFVTHDFVIAGYSLGSEEALAQAEETVFRPWMSGIVDHLRAKFPAAGADPSHIAVGRFLEVIHSLISDEAAKDKDVAGELALVKTAAGLSHSAIVDQTLDYSQFRVRGHYTKSPELGRYFQAMRYASTVLFYVRDSASTGVDAKTADEMTHRAELLADALAADPAVRKKYESLVGSLSTMFGPAEDLTLSDIVAEKREGEIAARRTALLEHARKDGHQPEILGGVVDVAHLEAGVTAKDALTGWRLFPQFRTVDAAAIQQLVFNKVGAYKGSKEPQSMAVIENKKVKAFPVGLELLALLGSKSAGEKLDATDERNYDGYEESSARAKKILDGPEGASSGWLDAAKALISEKTGGPEEQAQRLTAALALWTLDRHANLLYAKQSYTPVSKGVALAPDRSTAWLEPSVQVYEALLRRNDAVGAVIGKGLTDALAKILRTCIDISTAELASKPLDATQIAFLNNLDHEFFQLAGRDDNPVVVDVHTNASSSQVLEEAVGYPKVVEWKAPGKADAPALRGARFTQYEFRQPMAQRMTDEEWQMKAAEKK